MISYLHTCMSMADIPMSCIILPHDLLSVQDASWLLAVYEPIQFHKRPKTEKTLTTMSLDHEDDVYEYLP